MDVKKPFPPTSSSLFIAMNNNEDVPPKFSSFVPVAAKEKNRPCSETPINQNSTQSTQQNLSSAPAAAETQVNIISLLFEFNLDY